MKLLKSITVGLLVAAFLAAPLSVLAAEKSADKKTEKNAEKKTEKKGAKPKPYVLKVCPVSDEKLGGEMKPHVFEYKGREIKLCCKDCLADFNKEPAKFIKKIETAEAKLEKKSDGKADKKEKTKS